ncbi:MAG: hypothetical protein AB8H79_11215 [Myxococcota bacterium]
MDPLYAVICLACGIAIPVILVGLVIRRAHRQLSTAGAYREVAQALGLAVDTRGCSLHGIREDRSLWVGEVLVGDGPDRHREVHGVIGFQRPLALGLSLSAKRSRRQASQGLNHPELDKRLVVDVAFPAALDCVRDEAVQAALLLLIEMVNDVVVTDSRVRVRMKRAPSHASALGLLVDRLVAVAVALEEARAELGAAPELAEWSHTWKPVVDQWGLTVSTDGPRMSGRLAGWPVEVVPLQVEGRWRCWLAVRFGPDTDTGLRLMPQREADGDPSMGQDISIGEPVFDRAFVVKGYDPTAVRKRLQAPVRVALLALNRLGEVTLDDHRLLLRGVDTDQLGVALTQALVVAERVASTTAEPKVIDIN